MKAVVPVSRSRRLGQTAVRLSGNGRRTRSAASAPASPANPLDDLVDFLRGIADDADSRDFSKPVSLELENAHEKSERLTCLADAALAFARQSGVPFNAAESRIQAAVAVTRSFLDQEGGYIILADGTLHRLFPGIGSR